MCDTVWSILTIIPASFFDPMPAHAGSRNCAMDAAVKVPIWAKSDARVTVTWNYPDFIVKQSEKGFGEGAIMSFWNSRLGGRWFLHP